MSNTTYSKVYVSYAPTTPAASYLFELVNEPERYMERDTRVIFEATYNRGVKYAELHIGGEFYMREEIKGDWTQTQLVKDAIKAVQIRRAA